MLTVLAYRAPVLDPCERVAHLRLSYLVLPLASRYWSLLIITFLFFMKLYDLSYFSFFVKFSVFLRCQNRETPCRFRLSGPWKLHNHLTFFLYFFPVCRFNSSVPFCQITFGYTEICFQNIVVEPVGGFLSLCPHYTISSRLLFRRLDCGLTVPFQWFGFIVIARRTLRCSALAFSFYVFDFCQGRRDLTLNLQMTPRCL